MLKTTNHSSPLYSDKLVGLNDNFIFLSKLYNNNNFPRSLLVSGKKGIGKSTLILHFINYIFAKEKYNFKTNEIDVNSVVYRNIQNKIFQNLIFLNSDDIKKISIEDIRNLRKTIQKSTLNDLPRFIILDDIELFNTSSINALLKIIEEPIGNNYFILINNNQNKLIETIASRCLMINIYLKKNDRSKVIDYLIKKFNLETIIDYNNNNISPGLYLKYNLLSFENKISFDNDYLLNIQKIFNLYKKKKDSIYVNFLIFMTNDYFYRLTFTQKDNIEFINTARIKIIKIINNFAKYNLNVNSTFNEIQTKFTNV